MKNNAGQSFDISLCCVTHVMNEVVLLSLIRESSECFLGVFHFGMLPMSGYPSLSQYGEKGYG